METGPTSSAHIAYIFIARSFASYKSIWNKSKEMWWEMFTQQFLNSFIPFLDQSI